MSIDRPEPRHVAPPEAGRDLGATTAPRLGTRLPPGTLEALRRRDPAVLPALLDAHGRELAGVAFLILRDAAEAEDVVVDTLLTALERGSELRHDGALRSWLLRIATNRALAHRRRRRRIVALEVVDDPGEAAGLASRGLAGARADPAAETTRAIVLNAVNRLPPRMRAAVVLRYYSGCSVAKVAAILGRSPNTIKTELRTALERLRRDLGPELRPEGAPGESADEAFGRGGGRR